MKEKMYRRQRNSLDRKLILQSIQWNQQTSSKNDQEKR